MQQQAVCNTKPHIKSEYESVVMDWLFCSYLVMFRKGCSGFIGFPFQLLNCGHHSVLCHLDHLFWWMCWYLYTLGSLSLWLLIKCILFVLPLVLVWVCPLNPIVQHLQRTVSTRGGSSCIWILYLYVISSSEISYDNGSCTKRAVSAHRFQHHEKPVRFTE